MGAPRIARERRCGATIGALHRSHCCQPVDCCCCYRSHAFINLSSPCSKRMLRIVPAYTTSLLAVTFLVDHSPNQPRPLQLNRETCMAMCPTYLPLNFIFLNNLAGFGGCAVVRLDRKPEQPENLTPPWCEPCQTRITSPGVLELGSADAVLFCLSIARADAATKVSVHPDARRGMLLDLFPRLFPAHT